MQAWALQNPHGTIIQPLSPSEHKQWEVSPCFWMAALISLQRQCFTHMQQLYWNLPHQAHMESLPQLSPGYCDLKGELLSIELIVWVCYVWFSFKPAITPNSTVQKVSDMVKLWCNIWNITLTRYIKYVCCCNFTVQYSEMIVKPLKHSMLYSKSFALCNIVGLSVWTHTLCMHLAGPKIMTDSISSTISGCLVTASLFCLSHNFFLSWCFFSVTYSHTVPCQRPTGFNSGM